MSSQHDVLEVDNRDTSADEKKKRWKGLRDIFNTFQWYSEGDENKVLGESIDSYMTDLCNKAARCDLAQ